MKRQVGTCGKRAEKRRKFRGKAGRQTTEAFISDGNRRFASFGSCGNGYNIRLVLTVWKGIDLCHSDGRDNQ